MSTSVLRPQPSNFDDVVSTRQGGATLQQQQEQQQHQRPCRKRKASAEPCARQASSSSSAASQLSNNQPHNRYQCKCGQPWAKPPAKGPPTMSEQSLRQLVEQHAPCHESSAATMLAKIFACTRYNGAKWDSQALRKTTKRPSYCPAQHELMQTAAAHIFAGNFEGFQSCLDEGLKPNASDRFGYTLLHRVCKRSNWNMFRTLVSRGADPLVVDDCGRTLLHELCWGNLVFDPRIAVSLMETAPDLITAADRLGAVPLDYLHSHAALQSMIQVFVNNAPRFWLERSRGDPVRTPTESDRRHAYSNLSIARILPSHTIVEEVDNQELNIEINKKKKARPSPDTMHGEENQAADT